MLLISDEFKRPESLYFEIVFQSVLLLTHPTVDNEGPKRRTELIKYREQVTQHYPESSYIRRAMAQVVSLSPCRSRFSPRSVHVGFLVDRVALGQLSLRVLRFPCQYHSTVAQGCPEGQRWYRTQS
jgi:hypothetical protein